MSRKAVNRAWRYVGSRRRRRGRRRRAEPGRGGHRTSGTPAMNAIASTIAPSTIAEPRSPCSEAQAAADDGDDQRPARRRAPTGRAARRARRASRSAQNSSTRQLEELRRLEADGPNRTHALASLTVVADAGTNGSTISRTTTSSAAGCTSARQQWYGIAHRDRQPDEPERRPHHLAVEDAARAIALGGTGRPTTPTAPSPGRA